MQFIGNVEAKIDVKGRVFFPASFRRILHTDGEDRLIMRKDIYESCLVLYPESIWNQQLVELRGSLNRWNASHQRLYRQFVSDVEIIALDGNGRMLIPKRYLKSCGIAQDVRFIGMDDTIEIWAKEKVEISFWEPEAFGKELEKIMSEELSNE